MREREKPRERCQDIFTLDCEEIKLYLRFILNTRF